MVEGKFGISGRGAMLTWLARGLSAAANSSGTSGPVWGPVCSQGVGHLKATDVFVSLRVAAAAQVVSGTQVSRDMPTPNLGEQSSQGDSFF